MRDPVTAQTVHSEGPRPQPRDAKTVSYLEQAMVTRVTFRMKKYPQTMTEKMKQMNYEIVSNKSRLYETSLEYET